MITRDDIKKVLKKYSEEEATKALEVTMDYLSSIK